MIALDTTSLCHYNQTADERTMTKVETHARCPLAADVCLTKRLSSGSQGLGSLPVVGGSLLPRVSFGIDGADDDDGAVEGMVDGSDEGLPDGSVEGWRDGKLDGTDEGCPLKLGIKLGSSLGILEGEVDGSDEGDADGAPEGHGDGMRVGASVGVSDGTADGDSVGGVAENLTEVIRP